MNCHVCGANMSNQITSLPFKVSNTTIVIFKNLPVLQCDNCSEYLLEDKVLTKVESLLSKVNIIAELEIINYAA